MIKSQIIPKKPAYVTITVLILMMVLVGILYLFSDAVLADLAIARNNKGAQAAFALAEGGIQEAIYRVQHDTTAKGYFLAGAPDYPFSHNPALLNNGRYEVTIDNTAPGAATITSTGYYTMGIRTAKREIKLDIAQATVNPPYNDPGAMFTDAQSSATGDLDFTSAAIKIYGGGLIAGRNLNLSHDSHVIVEGPVKYVVDESYKHDSDIKKECLIDPPDPDPLNPPDLCSSVPACSANCGTQVLSSTISIPEIDFEAYKTAAGTQLYTPSEFLDLIPTDGQPVTFNGIVFITGSLNLTGNRNVIMNGVLASSDNISIGSSSTGSPTTVLTLNTNTLGAGGIISEKKVIIEKKGNLSGTGLIYGGEGTDLNSSSYAINLTGGILSRRITVTERTVTIHLNLDVINDTLSSPTDTPVIEINHWEEEY